MATEQPAQQANQKPQAFSKAYTNYVLIVLFVVYIFNFIDRQILTILAQPIKDELGISDGALGFLTGTAFALFYATLGIPIARLAPQHLSGSWRCTASVWPWARRAAALRRTP